MRTAPSSREPADAGLLRAALRSVRTTPPVVTRRDREPFATSLPPIVVILGWWIFALTMFAVGWPIDFARTNLGIVVALVVACTLTAGASYLGVARRGPRGVIAVRTRRTPVIVSVGFIGSVVLLIPWVESYSGFHVWEILQALSDQAAAFELSSERINEGTLSRAPIVAAQVVLAPAMLTVIPFAALGWFERRQHGWLLVGAVAIQVAMSVFVGRDLYTSTAVVLTVGAWYVSRVRRGMPLRFRAVLAVVASAIVFLIVFGIRKYVRMGGVEFCTPGAVGCSSDPTPISLGESIVSTVVTYSSHSMEGLGRALLGEWRFGGGYSHFSALRSLVESLSGSEGPVVITDQLVDHGWSDSMYWSTGFAWIANDVPWVVVPVVVAIMAGFLAWTWRRAVRWGDWLSVTLFCYGWLNLFYLAQNFQLGISGPIYLGYLALCLLFVARECRRALERRRRAVTTRQS